MAPRRHRQDQAAIANTAGAAASYVSCFRAAACPKPKRPDLHHDVSRTRDGIRAAEFTTLVLERRDSADTCCDETAVPHAPKHGAMPRGKTPDFALQVFDGPMLARAAVRLLVYGAAWWPVKSRIDYPSITPSMP